MRLMSRITFCLSYLCKFTTHLLDPRWGPNPPPLAGARVPIVDVFYVDGGRSRVSSSDTSQGAYRRRFLALLVGALGSPASAPPSGAPSMFFTLMVDALGSPTAPPRGAHHRRFLALMVDAPGSLASAPPRGPTVDVFYVDGERS
jgi:hypothetical protein